MLQYKKFGLYLIAVGLHKCGTTN